MKVLQVTKMGGEDSERNLTEENEKKEVKSQVHSVEVNVDQGDDTVQVFDSNLPKTVSLLHGPNGSKLYLVGTAHFSLESQEDVSKVIRTVKPHIVVVELCRSRSSILRLDEKTIEEEACNLSFAKMKEIIKENGFLQGMMNILLLSVSAQLTRDLGMAPGGEFRRAFQEVKKIPGCMLHFGDRPIHITLNRALAVLSWWQRLRLAYSLVFENHTFTKADVEQFKESDLLASILKKMSTEFPEIGEVFIRERDLYLTFSLQAAVSCGFYNEANVCQPTVAVGVVGIGHTPGIKELWMKVSDEDVQPILVIEQKKSRGIVKKTIIVGGAALLCYQISKRVNFGSIFNELIHWLRH